MNNLELACKLKTTRQKKRLVKEDKEKQLIQLHKERIDIWDQIRSTPLIELETPYQNGYKRFYILREDVARSKDFMFFENLLSKINTIMYSENRKFLKRKRKHRIKIWTERVQSLRNIDEWEWIQNKLKLTEKEKDYFCKIEKYDPKTKSKKVNYKFIESWRYRLKIVPNIITHYKPIDIELESRNKQIENYLDKNFLNEKLQKIVYGKCINRYCSKFYKELEIENQQRKELIKIKKEKLWEI